MANRFTVFDPQKDTPTAFDFEEGFNGKMMGDILDVAEKAKDDHGRLHLLVEMDRVPTLTWDAIAAKMGRAGQFRKMPGRYAVVTDKGWMQKLTPLAQGAVKMQIRVFPSGMLKEATEWAKAG